MEELLIAASIIGFSKWNFHDLLCVVVGGVGGFPPSFQNTERSSEVNTISTAVVVHNGAAE